MWMTEVPLGWHGLPVMCGGSQCGRLGFLGGGGGFQDGLGLLRTAEPVAELVALHLLDVLGLHAQGDEALLLILDALALGGTLLLRTDFVLVAESTGCHVNTSLLYQGLKLKISQMNSKVENHLRMDTPAVN